jgi:transcriptional regulator GlxA family with amidase domain
VPLEESGRFHSRHSLPTSPAPRPCPPPESPSSSRGGLVTVPDYSLRDVPRPDIVLVPAQGHAGIPVILDWIKRAHRRGAVIASVCVGARELDEAGLLDGLAATSHHGPLDALRELRPAVHFVGGVRFVNGSPTIYTAGGLTSRIDLALTLVRNILGIRAARGVAEQLEYEGRRREAEGIR